MSLVVFLPLLGAILLAFLPSSRPQRIRWAALGIALATWVVSLAMLVGSTPPTPGYQYIESVAVDPDVRDHLLGRRRRAVARPRRAHDDPDLDPLLASFGPIQTRVKEYMISFLILEVGMIGVFVALDLFLFYIFWELVLVPMYLIIGIWGGKNRIYATIKFVLYTLVGSLLMLVAILATAYTYQAATGDWTGAFDVEPLTEFAGPARSAALFGILAFGAFFLAFAIKVPMFPFHTWLPDAHVEAPTAGSVILAGVLLKLGGYGFIRFALPLFPEAAQRGRR